MKKAIHTTGAPAAIGPYSQGIAVGSMVFVSGQLPVDPATGELISDIGKATARSLDNVKNILAEAGCGMEDVVKTTVLMKDLGDFDTMNEVYAGYFPENAPARACFQVAKLPKDAVIEIEAIAVSAKRRGGWP